MPREPLEHGVTGGMAVRTIDLLEMIEADHRNAPWRLAALCLDRDDRSWVEAGGMGSPAARDGWQASAAGACFLARFEAS